MSNFNNDNIEIVTVNELKVGDSMALTNSKTSKPSVRLLKEKRVNELVGTYTLVFNSTGKGGGQFEIQAAGTDKARRVMQKPTWSLL